jgi:hypothetical protein
VSWPPTLVDWFVVTSQLQHGDLVCVVHGPVDAVIADWELPVCPHCRQLLSRTDRDRTTGRLRHFVEPAPAYCAGTARHPTLPGRVQLGWRSCGCTNVLPGPGGHLWWRCTAQGPPAGAGTGVCGAYATWPPHQDELHPMQHPADLVSG